MISELSRPGKSRETNLQGTVLLGAKNTHPLHVIN